MVCSTHCTPRQRENKSRAGNNNEKYSISDFTAMVRVPTHRITYKDAQAAGYMAIFFDVPVAVIARHLGVNANSLGRRIRLLRATGWVPFPPTNALQADRLVDTFFFPGTPLNEILRFLVDAVTSIDLCVYVQSA